MTTFLPEEFLYYPDEWKAEEPMRYEPGGYHPIIIGNILRSPARTSSYRIINKLGHGSFSTVWLAENSDSQPKYVAVKVSTADGMSSREADYLRSVSSPYVASVFDSFSLEGPNGLHHILVTEVLLPFGDFLTIPHTLGIRRKLIWELVKAVEDLHAVGLVHGDLHLGNTGITLPQIQALPILELILDTNDPLMTAILLDDMTKDTTSLPAYVKLFDFGSVRRHDDDSGNLMYEQLSRAPEIVRASKEVDHAGNPPLQPPLDIWALGTLIYRIITGFDIFAATDLYSSDASISEADRRTREAQWWKNMWINLRKHCISDTDCNTLVSLFKKIFVLEPSERPSAATIAQDDWFHETHETYNNAFPRPYTTLKDM